jgi:hypothetical protein
MDDDELAKRRLCDACRALLQVRAKRPEIVASLLFALNDENWETVRELAELELDA